MAKLPTGTLVSCVETAFLTTLLAWQAFRLWPAISHAPSNIALLIADALPVLLIAFGRRARTISQEPTDWITAYGATLAPLLLFSGGEPLVDTRVCGALMVLGLALHLYGKVCLARSFGLVAANRGVQCTGAYRVIRHPIYAGYAVTQLGFVLMYPSLSNLLLSTAGLALQVVRLRAEERLLGQDPIYARYMIEVPYRLAPGVF